jgi:hypothetical protein
MKKVAAVLKDLWPFLLGLGSGLYFITLNITGKTFLYFPGNLIDARFFMYILEHSYKFIIGQDQSLWNAQFMYPENNVITYADNLLGTALFYSPFRLIGLDRETSFQCWFVLITCLNYSFSFMLLRYLFKNKYAAALGSMIFTFSMALQYQLLHAQTFTRFPIPLALWMCILFSEDFKPIYFFGAVFFVVYQFYCGIYLGLMLSIPIGICLTLSVILKWRKFVDNLRSLNWVGRIVIAIVINLVLIGLLMYPYYQRAQTLEAYKYSKILNTVPTIKSYFFSLHGSLFWNFISGLYSNNTAWYKSPEWMGHQIFPGGIVIISVLLTIVIIGYKIIKINSISTIRHISTFGLIMITGVVTAILFMRYKNISCYRLFFSIPGFNSMRQLTRIINVELIFFSFTVAFVFNYFFQNKKKLTVVIFIFITFLIVADNYFEEGSIYRTNKIISQKRISALTEKMKSFPEKSVISYESPFLDYRPEFYQFNAESRPAVYQLDAMLATQALNLKCVNAYTANAPDEFSGYLMFPCSPSREVWLKAMGCKDTRIYIVH